MYMQTSEMKEEFKIVYYWYFFADVGCWLNDFLQYRPIYKSDRRDEEMGHLLSN